jgi:hypothetical protein
MRILHVLLDIAVMGFHVRSSRLPNEEENFEQANRTYSVLLGSDGLFRL